MALKLGRLKVVRIGIEGTKGSAGTANVEVLAYDPVMNPDAGQFIQREPGFAYGGQFLGEIGASVGQLSFRTELRGNGTSGLDVGIAALLQGAGMKVTTGVYKPCTSVADQKCLTMDLFEDGMQKRLIGAMGDWSLTAEAGKPIYLDWTFSGIFSKAADAALPVVTHTAQPPMLAKSMTLTLGAYAAKVGRLTIAANNPVEMREDVTAAQGVAHYLIGPGRRYLVGMDSEAEAAATWDAYTLWAAKTTAALAIAISDGTVDVAIAAPVLQHTAPQAGLRGSLLTHQLLGQCCLSTGDDEISITPS